MALAKHVGGNPTGVKVGGKDNGKGGLGNALDGWDGVGLSQVPVNQDVIIATINLVGCVRFTSSTTRVKMSHPSGKMHLIIG